MEQIKTRYITKEEELNLIKKVKEGDDYSFQLLWEFLKPIYLNISNKFNLKGIDEDDVFMAGQEGLRKSIQKFDLNSGNRLSTLAQIYMNKEIQKIVFKCNNTIQLNHTIYEDNYKINKISEKLKQKYFREPTYDEIAKESNNDLTPKRIKEVKEYVHFEKSLDYVSNGEDGLNLYETISYEEEEDNQDERLAWIKQQLKSFTYNEQFIIMSRYFHQAPGGVNLTLEQAAEYLNICPETVRTTEKRVIEKLRELVRE